MTLDSLDLITTILGLLYIYLEYRAHIALWVVGIIMPALDVFLYYRHGLYGDAGMAVYYTLAAVYGLLAWSYGSYKSYGSYGSHGSHKSYGSHGSHGSHKSYESHKPHEPAAITHMPLRLYPLVALFFLLAWAATYFVLVTWTNSTVPLLDSFTNALSFVGLWALARKYIEQWGFWIVVDAVCTVLYIQKGIPFKAALYGLYVVIAVMGFFKWKKLAASQASL